MNQPLFVPDLAALKRKLAAPPPLLAKCYARFQERLARDVEFRRHHIFLPALLGEPAALAEAKEQILTMALNPPLLAEGRPGARRPGQDSLDNHIWCIAPRAMRIAVYFTWLDIHGAWTSEERRAIAAGLMDFFYNYVIPVLRARTPGGHNQQLSMTFCSTVAGHVFAGDTDRARALRDYAMPKFKQSLGLMPASGYSGEGSTYQSDVVSGLILWAGVFLEQLGEHDIWNRRWEPNGACMADTLRMESYMGSCGGLLPPWDNYGWQPTHNLAARTLWAGLSGNPALLQAADTAWDVFHHLAWRPDDRLWTLLYWPESEEGIQGSVFSVQKEGPGTDNPPPTAVLSGWSVPAVGAAIEHRPRRLRVMTAWDECSGNLQGLGRAQVNPNHLIVDLAGEPVTGDGWDLVGIRLASGAALDRTRQSLSPVEHDMVVRQYGSFEYWVRVCESGFLGAACAIVVDGWDSYFPRQARQGQLVFERRESERHTFAGEAASYYQPAFDVTRMRRTVSMGVAGIAWIVDDIRAGSPHAFTWRVWLRRDLRPAGPRAMRLDLECGAGLALAWLVEADGSEQPGAVSVEKGTLYPQKQDDPRFPWPGRNTHRCELTATGRRVRFVTCLVPEGVDGLQVRQTAPGAWEATWNGGSDRFSAPPEIEAVPDAEPVMGVQITEKNMLCDLDEAPFALLDEPDEALLAALDRPPVEAWRRTGAAMQTLAVRGNRDAMPKSVALLLDVRQNYTVHSVAAWCLGHARYRPALDLLRRISKIPEVNTALRAAWAVERMERGDR